MLAVRLGMRPSMRAREHRLDSAVEGDRFIVLDLGEWVIVAVQKLLGRWRVQSATPAAEITLVGLMRTTLSSGTALRAP